MKNTKTVGSDLISVNPMDSFCLTDEEIIENKRKKSIYKRKKVLMELKELDISSLEEPVMITKEPSQLMYIDYVY